MNDLAYWLKNSTAQAVIKAGIFHHQFQFYHPFMDGNGRIGRILTSLILAKAGYKINKYFVLDDYYDVNRYEYSDKLHSADYADETAWLEYFSEGVMHSLESALIKIDEGMKYLNVELRPTVTEQKYLDFLRELPQFTSQDLQGKFGVSRQQVHNILSALIEKGYVRKIGETRGAYYEVV
jgi:Fic family protein